MTRKSIKGVYSPEMDDKKPEPIIENSRAPSMDDKESKAPKSLSAFKAQNLMPKPNAATVKVTKKEVSAGKVMAPFSASLSNKPKANAATKVTDQVEKRSRPGGKESYVVFRMRVQNGVISVTGSKKVNSKLEIHENLIQGGVTYEATLKDKRIGLGSIADFGERRSFPRPGQKEHHITILPSFDFNVKVPSNQIELKDLPKLKVSLFRFKEHVRRPSLGPEPLDAQFDKEARLVAQLDGIKLTKLNKDVKALVKKAVGK